MNIPRFRAWQFIHPDLDVDTPGESPGLQIAATGGIGMVEEEISIRQAVLLLFSTMPGERVMRPDYGCELHQLIFSPNDTTTAGLAIHYVREAVERWEPRIEILNLDAGQHEVNPEQLVIYLEYRIRATQHTGELAFSINLTGEQ